MEIQDWIEDTFEKKQATSMFQYHETKQLPMQTDLKNDMDSLRSESDYKFEKLIFEMRAGFKSLQDEIRTQTEITNARFEAMDSKFEARFDAMDSKFEAKFDAMDSKFEAKFDALDSKFEAKFDALDSKFEAKFDALDSKFEGKFDSLDSKFQSIDSRFQSIDHQFQSIDHRFQSIDSRFESLEKRLDSTNFYLRLIGVPIIGATLSGVGVTFLYIWERLHKTIGF